MHAWMIVCVCAWESLSVFSETISVSLSLFPLTCFFRDHSRSISFNLVYECCCCANGSNTLHIIEIYILDIVWIIIKRRCVVYAAAISNNVHFDHSITHFFISIYLCLSFIYHSVCVCACHIFYFFLLVVIDSISHC